MIKRLQTSLALLAATISIGCTDQVLSSTPKAPNKLSGKPATAIFAGGCFWCMELDFEKLPGVIDVESGFTGGHVVNPTYRQVSAGITGHAESIQVTYDPETISYRQLLDHFWVNIDPTVANRQFCDKGSQYRSGIFFLNKTQQQAANASKMALEKSARLKHVATPITVPSNSYPGEFQLEAQRHAEAEAKHDIQQKRNLIHTEIAPAGIFYPAEEYHQNYHKKNPIRYRIYRTQCGRDARLIHIWGKRKKH